MTTTPTPGFTSHQESTTTILIPTSASTNSTETSEVFINPVQEYNRDLSIAAIRAWSSLRDDEFIARRNAKLARSKKPTRGKGKHDSKRALIPDQVETNSSEIPIEEGSESKKARLDTPVSEKLEMETETAAVNENQGKMIPDVVQSNYILPPQEENGSTDASVSVCATSSTSQLKAPKFTALEALSATGLRAIRYAKEIPSMKWIIANDLSASAVKYIDTNIAHNGLDVDETDGKNLPRVRSNLGDACDVMYTHRQPGKQFDLVDLDPYGTAAPFMDAAVQCITDGGLLCVTCTDLAVLAGSAYPEKCFANYGGTSLRAEYSHEYALRQVIHALATSAARYGKYVKPLLSLSIDFYVRIFVRVYTSPVEVKKAMVQTALVYVCSNCSSHHLQPLGRSQPKPTRSGEGVNNSYGTSAGPPVPGPQCTECGGKFHVAGPLWSGALHDQTFMNKVLEDAERSDCGLNTASRIKGMVGIAKMELPNVHFFFTPAKLSGLFHCNSPSLTNVASALLNGGYQVSRSHCQPGSIKTDAPRSFIHDVMRKWIEANPVKMSNIKEGSPAHVLLSKPIMSKISFDKHPEVDIKMQTNVKVVRYQNNPLPNWGPKTKAKSQ
ncbi:tRNA methyltransferase [Melampsora americana]|nr:tRNA methyltransferase [Melampsora americana]